MFAQYAFQTTTILIGALSASAVALVYFRQIRLERPAIGVFNMRDISILLFFILVLPLLYLVLPIWALTTMLTLTFTGALYLALRPLLRPLFLWPAIIFLLGGDIWVTYHYLGEVIGWQVYWIFGSLVMLLASSGVANLYVQGGMRLRHVAWFSFILAFYDLFFVMVIPLSARLADLFIGHPLDPSIGFRMGPYSANIGLGDLLVFCCFTVAAYKGFGKRGAIAAFVIITFFGAIIPSLSPLIISTFVRNSIGIVVPAQASFGPAALVTYLLLARQSKERSMKEWLAQEAANGYGTAPGSRIVRRVAEQPALADIQRSVQGTD